jgi:hypothetical protein
MWTTTQAAHLGKGQQQSSLNLSDSPVPPTRAMRKHNLVAIRISDYNYADLLAPHDQLRFNTCFLAF